jgi:hypothetical protein
LTELKPSNCITTPRDSEWDEKQTEHSISKLTVKEQTKTGGHKGKLTFYSLLVT